MGETKNHCFHRFEAALALGERCSFGDNVDMPQLRLAGYTGDFETMVGCSIVA